MASFATPVLHLRLTIALVAALFWGTLFVQAGELRVSVLRISETCVGQKPTVTIQLENFNPSFAVQGVMGTVSIRQGATTVAEEPIGTHTLAANQKKDVDVAVDWTATTTGAFTAQVNAQGVDNINGPQTATRNFTVCPATPCPPRPAASGTAIYVGTGTTGTLQYSIVPSTCCFELKATLVTGRNAIQSITPDTWSPIGATRDVSVTVNRAELIKGSTVLRVDWRACDRSTFGSDYVLVLDGTPSAPTLPQQPAGVTGGQTTMSGTEADPVLTATREMHIPVQRLDAEVLAQLPIAFERNYLSRLAEVRPQGSGFGPNWSHSYDYAASRSGSVAVVLQPNGGEAVFSLGTNNRWDIVYPSNEPLSFGVEGDSVMRLANRATGVVHEFASTGQLTGVGLASGYFSRIRWESPTWMTIKTPSGKGVSLVTDSLGRFTSITGGAWTGLYTYSAGMLVGHEVLGVPISKTQYVYRPGTAFMTSWVTPMGRTPLTIDYDDSGRVLSQDFGDGEIYRFSGTSGVTNITFPTGEVVVHRHDAMNRLTSIQRPDGEAVFGYDIRGNRSTVSDFGGGRTARTFLNGLVGGAEYANGGGYSIDYSQRDSRGVSVNEVEKIEILQGGTTTYGRDATTGVVNLITRSGRGSRAFEYAPGSTLPSRVTDFGVDVRYTWTPDGLPATIRLRDGETLTYTYNEFNYPTRIESTKPGNTQTFSWSPAHDLTSWGRQGGLEQWNYDGDGLMTRYRNLLGHETTWWYNNRGRLAEFREPARAPLQISWKGQDVSRIHVGDYFVDYTWSWDKNRVTTADNNGLSTSLHRNADGVPTTIVLPGNRTVELGVNSMGWTSGITLPSGLKYDYDYNTTGDITKIEGPARTDEQTRRNRDGTSYEQTIGGRIRLQFESSFTGSDRLTTKLTDGDGFEWTVGIDSERSQLTLPSGKAITANNDAYLRPYRIDYGGGAVTNYEYTNGWLTGIRTESDSVNVQRDAEGRITDFNAGQISRDSAGRITRAGTTVATYNADGTRKSVSWAAGLTVEYGYENGRLKSIRDHRGDETQVEYNTYGLLSGYRFPDNFELKYEYDVDGNVRKVSTSDGWWMEYTWQNGRVASVTRSDNVLLDLHVGDWSYRYTNDNQREGADYSARGHLTNDPDRMASYQWGLYGLTSIDHAMETHRFAYSEFGTVDRVSSTDYNVGIRFDYSATKPLPAQFSYGSGDVDDIINAFGRLLYLVNPEGQRTYLIDDGFGNVVATRNSMGDYSQQSWYTPYGESVTTPMAPYVPFLGYQGTLGEISIGTHHVPTAPRLPANLSLNSYLDHYFPVRIDLADRYRMHQEHLNSLSDAAYLNTNPAIVTIDPPVLNLQSREPFSLTTKLKGPVRFPGLNDAIDQFNDPVVPAVPKGTISGTVLSTTLRPLLPSRSSASSEFSHDHDELVKIFFGDGPPVAPKPRMRAPEEVPAHPMTQIQKTK